MSNDDKCPCVDGLPGPCTLCGAPADGVCEIDTLVGWKHRAQRAEAEARQLREAITSAPGELRNAALSVARDGNVDTVSAERWITWFTHLHAAVAARDFGTGARGEL